MEVIIKEEKVTQQEKKIIGTQVPMEIYEKLKSISDREFMSVSDLLRKIISLYLRDNEQC